MYKTMIGIPNGGDLNPLRVVCKNIRLKDNTFKFRVIIAKGELAEKFKGILIIYSITKEMAEKRGGWFIHKMKDAKVADYFWTKECKDCKED